MSAAGYRGAVRDEWRPVMTPGEHIAAREADTRARVDAASALLGMGLSVAAKFVLDEPDADNWPGLRQAREWQSSQRHDRARLDGVA